MGPPPRLMDERAAPKGGEPPPQEAPVAPRPLGDGDGGVVAAAFAVQQDTDPPPRDSEGGAREAGLAA